MAKPCCSRSTKALAGTTRVVAHSWPKPFEQGSTGQPQCETRKTSCDVTSPAKNSPAGHTPEHQNSKPYNYPGRSPHGDLIWWAQSRNPQKKVEHTSL